MRPVLVISALGVAGLSLAGCGGKAPIAAPPPAVPIQLAPTTLGTDLALSEYAPARHTFAVAGKDSLVADGRLWQIRRGDTLVGTLQIATVKPSVSTARTRDRDAILQGIMTGSAFDTINVDNVTVATATAGDKNVYMWFGHNLFEVMQLKSTKLDPETVLHDVISFQEPSGLLLPASPSPQPSP